MAIEFYKELGSLGYLANYSNHGFLKNGIFYKTAEHYYQSEKFDDKKIKEKIIDASSPKEASNIGRNRNYQRRENFKDIKLEVMYQAVLEKFRQNKDIRARLIETRNEPIKEMTTKESFWGVGPNFDGQNNSGKILEVVREKIKEEVILNIIKKCKGKKIYVIGHENPDVDSIFSSLILTNILRSFGINAVFSVRDNNFIDKELINDYLKDNYEIISNYNHKSFILVDHNNLLKMDKYQVIGAFDHHKITNDIENLIEIEYASTGLLLYDLFKGYYKFNDYEQLLIALTVLSDTEYLTSSRFTKEDKKIFSTLGINLNFKKIQKKYFKITDFTKKIEFNLNQDKKTYKRKDLVIKRSLIKSYSQEKQKYYIKYKKAIKEYNIDLLIWCDYECKKTYLCTKKYDLIFPYFTTSTNLILDYLNERNYL